VLDQHWALRGLPGSVQALPLSFLALLSCRKLSTVESILLQKYLIASIHVNLSGLETICNAEWKAFASQGHYLQIGVNIRPAAHPAAWIKFIHRFIAAFFIGCCARALTSRLKPAANFKTFRLPMVNL
jgi:hypothetical protein